MHLIIRYMLAILLLSSGNIIVNAQSDMTSEMHEILDWNKYPQYNHYIQFMDSMHQTYSSITQLVPIGTSTNNRSIRALKISDKPLLNEDEPKVFFSSSIHGDELTGYVLLLRLIHLLLNNYYTDLYFNELINSTEIYICPIENPDGAYYSSNSTVADAIRYNVNGYDLNRNYPYPSDVGTNPNPVQPETEAMIEFLQSVNFTLGMNIHGGAELVNYPWDYKHARHPDDLWYQHISKQYADSAIAYSGPGYFTKEFTTGYSNGYDWYQIYGSRQDYANYFTNNREITVEISDFKTPSGSMLPYYWEANYRSFLNLIQNARYGFSGKTIDKNSGLPVQTIITLGDHDNSVSAIQSDSQTGYFNRVLLSGTYQAIFSATGYADTTIVIQLATNESHVDIGTIFLNKIPTDTRKNEEKSPSIVPVPAKDYIIIKDTVTLIPTVNIYNINGKSVVRITNYIPGNLIDTSSLERGLYIVQFFDGNKTYTSKFIRE